MPSEENPPTSGGEQQQKKDQEQSGNGTAAGMPLSSNEQVFQAIRSIGEECIEDEELRSLLSGSRQVVAYDGFEPSGRMHLAQGLLKTLNINKCTDNGIDYVIWIADWFAYLNGKIGGNLKNIQTMGRYMIEVWKAAGLRTDRVKFLWASEEINKRSDEYWTLVFDIAKNTTINRVLRCTQIMGRQQGEDNSTAYIFYPVMQCADIFFLKANICQLGLDQRKVNMLAREYAGSKGLPKPVILSHHMLLGLLEGQEKMSKSDQNSAIFMDDSLADVNRKIKRAFCRQGEVDKNPIIDYCKHIVFPTGPLLVERAEIHGNNLHYAAYEAFEADWVAGLIHPEDLKKAVSKRINELLEPVRTHFKENAEAKALLESVKRFISY